MPEPSNTFAFRLLRELATDAPAANVFVSPLSVTLALGMALVGARGETARELAGLLDLGEDPPARLAALGALLEQAGADPAARVTAANALWCSRRFTPRPEYVERCRELFRAAVETLDFGSPTAAGVINRWVSDHTAGKIPRIVQSLDPSAALVFTNAVHFKGTWAHQFDPARTRPAPFALPGGATCQVPMMWLSRKDLAYAETADYQAISLPYGERRAGRLCMDIVLPRPGRALGDLLRALDAQAWGGIVGRLRAREGELHLPRFTAEYEQELVPALRRLGLRRATSGQADFSGIGEGPLTIDQVLHRAALEVNEEGAEAAAATAVVMVLSAMVAPPPPFVMRVDRPFLCAIRDRASGLVLFLGTIANPG
ncbi:MAG TPA: serpin family protein [Roseiflexaceae bacterium]|nr:serpin family protein [Roseiflexaceae bacterium]